MRKDRKIYIRKTDTNPIVGPLQCKNHHMCVSFQLSMDTLDVYLEQSTIISTKDK